MSDSMTRIKANLTGALCAFATLLFASNAFGASVTTDQAAFNAATTGLVFQTEDFETQPDQFSFREADFGPFVFRDNLADASASDTASVTDCGGNRCIDFISFGFLLTFDEPVNAVSFLIADSEGLTSDIQVDGQPAGSVVVPAGSGVFSFVGIFDLATPFTTVAVPFFFQTADVDDISFATATAIPLPGGLPLMLAVGLGFLGMARRQVNSG
ncbi:MAG: hypothetical protein AAGH74_07225 [Pseudomonadota bacterium]